MVLAHDWIKIDQRDVVYETTDYTGQDSNHQKHANDYLELINNHPGQHLRVYQAWQVLIHKCRTVYYNVEKIDEPAL